MVKAEELSLCFSVFFFIIKNIFDYFSQTVALWDLRNLKLKLHSFESHKDEIFQVSHVIAVSSLLVFWGNFSNLPEAA